jgi:hypothetical protein
MSYRGPTLEQERVFNFDHYESRMKEICATIEAAEDQSWRDTLDRRFVMFSLNNVATRIIRLSEQMGSDAVVLDPAGLATFACAELSKHVGTLVEAITLIAGRTTLKNPVVSEAQLRLYKELGGN